MRVEGRLFQTQDRCEADVSVFHKIAPMGLRVLLDQRGDDLFQFRPFGCIHLIGKTCIVFQAKRLQEQSVKLGLYSAD